MKSWPSSEPEGDDFAVRFLAAVFAGVDDGHIHLYVLDRETGSKEPLWFHVNDTAEMARAAAALPDDDIWFSTATRAKPMGRQRGGSQDCSHIAALWADIDIAGPNHAASDLPGSIDDAYDLVRDFPLPPSIVVETGGGIQPWWLLSEPIERDTAAAFLVKWGATWAELGRRRNVHVDNVFDLARVMRLPGTSNHKAEPPQPVRLAEMWPDRRYTLDDLDQWTIDPPEPLQPSERRTVPYIGPERPGDAFNASADLGRLVEQLGCVYDHESNGDRHYRAPHHDKRGETGIVVYADGHVTVYSETFAKQYPSLRVKRPYDAFGFYTHTKHAGQWAAASDSLAVLGYGTKNVVPPWETELYSDLSGHVAPEDDGDEWADVDLAYIAEQMDAGNYSPTVPTMLAVRDGMPLLYPGRINALFGESGGGKTWCALAAIAERLRDGQRVMFIDWEDNANGITERLRLLGLSRTEIALVSYKNPASGLAMGLEAFKRDARRYGMIVLDSTGEAMAAGGVDSNSDAEVARWFALVKSLCRLPGEPCVLVLDHIPKDKEAPSNYAIGSQRKRAAVTGAAYRVDTLKEPAKGRDGLLRLTVAKDRPGNRAKGTVAAMVDFNTGDGMVTLDFHMSDAQVAEINNAPFRPTVLMERVSRWLELNPRSSGWAIRTTVKGNENTILDALSALIDEGCVSSEPGPRGAVLYSVVRSFREIDDRFGSESEEESSSGASGADRCLTGAKHHSAQADSTGATGATLPEGVAPLAPVSQRDATPVDSRPSGAKPKGDFPW